MIIQSAKPTKIEIERSTGKFFLVVTMIDGFRTCFGDIKTEAGAKRMLAIHAKRHGLKVNGSTAT